MTEHGPWRTLVEMALAAASDPEWETEAAAPLAAVISSAAAARLAARLRAAVPEGGEPTDLLRDALAELAAMPLLMAYRRRLSARAEGWTHGYCPICGAWPTVAELRGLDRERRLRCGRCGADWAFLPLLCPYCGNDDHERQRQLVPERGGDSLRIDACDACQGYVKTLATLRAIRPEQVALEDLASVELDLAALEKGYQYPDRRSEAVRVVVP